jgi:murein endopeptidase
VALLAARQAEPLPVLPPLTPVQEVQAPVRSVDGPVQVAREPAVSAQPAPTVKPARDSAASRRQDYPAIRWRNSQAIGLPHAGSLVDGVRLPIKSQDWVTWDPVRNRVPNRPNRLYGTDMLVRLLVGVIAEYSAAHPKAPRVVVGDLSLRGGGEIDEHVSHENGLDVDVYYPRRDGKAVPPHTVGQIDLRLSQELLDRFLAAGAQIVFVGYSVPLHGPQGVVMPYPSHDNHMHVRISPSRGRP